MSKLVIIGGHDCMACKYKGVVQSNITAKRKFYPGAQQFKSSRLATLIW